MGPKNKEGNSEIGNKHFLFCPKKKKKEQAQRGRGTLLCFYELFFPLKASIFFEKLLNHI